MFVVFLSQIVIQSETTDFPAITQYQTKKLAAISDIHGQYNSMKQLLMVHGIIDEQLNWSFGTGHLVITGDVFDRGEQVTEALWLYISVRCSSQTSRRGASSFIG